MEQNNLRQQVYFMKRMLSYRTIAKELDIAQSSFYSWLDGNYNLKEDLAERLQEYITNYLLEKTEGNKKYKTVRNLLALLAEYHFDDDEVLAEIPKYYDNNSRYYITNKAKVFSLCGSSWIMKKPQKDENGYYYVDLYCNGERTRRKVHQLVIEAFMPSIDLDGLEIHHIDFDRSCNTLDNLIPLTREQHAKIHKFIKKWSKGDNNI